MRPQQQNRRMRGRNNNGGGNNNNNNNNRKGPNPLSRNYESNGPDVKIRGSAQQIAEKYAALARDAMSSGDRVMAENYLQHAEHYNRIIAAAQAQMPIQQVQQNRDEFDDDGEDDRDDFDGNLNGNENQVSANNGSGPQPVIEGTPAEVALNSESAGENRGNRDNRENGGGRNRERRPGGYNQNGQRGEFRQRNDQDNAQNVAQSEAAPSEEPQPVEAAVVENLGPAALAARAELNEANPAEEAAPRRPRRPRRPRVSADDAAGGAAEPEAVVSES
ncbi:MAG: hypothetical protein BGO03_02005 [Mesorhizobium sp. 61-13]|nr:MAG: hypothetical protein BGO03_02005 [Mesorhizobium sp. 61-13]